MNSATISVVLEGVDRIKELLLGLEATGEEQNVDSAKLIQKLNQLASSGETLPGRMATPKTPGADSEPSSRTVDAEIRPAESASILQLHSGQPPNSDPHSVAADAKISVADLSIRVNVDALDRLIGLVDELDLTRNQLLQLVRGEVESKYAVPIAQLDRVTTDLREGVMKTRMLPISQAWNKLPRLVRDLSRVTGKPLELEMYGAETELDRPVLDAIMASLMHMVRNSADHGIETPEVRRAVGKPEAGRLTLSAFHDGEHVVVCLEDDGAGIDRRKVLRKAIANGLITETEAGQLPDAEIVRLIFRPGFSTAEQVTTISGRGVGMDVVRTEIERIGGGVVLTSVPGRGTKVRLQIPLTTAVIAGKAPDVLDTQHDLMRANADDFQHAPVKPQPRKVLIVDDSLFFRHLAKTALEADCYLAMTVDSAERRGVDRNGGELRRAAGRHRNDRDGRLPVCRVVPPAAEPVGNAAGSDDVAGRQGSRPANHDGGIRPAACQIPAAATSQGADGTSAAARSRCHGIERMTTALTWRVDQIQPIADLTNRPTVPTGWLVRRIPRIFVGESALHPSKFGRRAGPADNPEEGGLLSRIDWNLAMNGSMKRILLVDDSRSVRLAARRIISVFDFEVFEAENGEHALRVLRENQPIDAVLLDWNMPVMDGMAFLKAVRADDDLPQPRVVMCTTENELHRIMEAIHSGADEYIMKPFTAEVVREKLQGAGVL